MELADKDFENKFTPEQRREITKRQLSKVDKQISDKHRELEKLFVVRADRAVNYLVARGWVKKGNHSVAWEGRSFSTVNAALRYHEMFLEDKEEDKGDSNVNTTDTP